MDRKECWGDRLYMKQWVLLWTLAPGIITGTSQPPVTAGMKKTQRWKVHIYDPMGQSPRSAASTSLPKESLSSDKKRQLIYIVCMHAKLLQTCLTLCDPMDCRPPGSSVHGILQGRILEGVAMPSSKGSSQPGVKPASLTSTALTGGFFTSSAIWEALRNLQWKLFSSKKFF